MSRFRSALVIVATLPVLLLGGCGDSSDSVTGPAPTIETAAFASSLGIDLSKFTKAAGGLYYRDLVVGSGAVIGLGQTASVYYTGYFTNGSTFDSRSAPATAFAFQVGTGQVIQGWDLGVVGMRVGGQRQLIIPPSLGYGSSNYQTIPGNSILVFTITAVSVK